MSSITVLCPNARRQQVKVQPGTKVIDILDEVCKKQGYKSNEHELVYQKRKLDITLTYRLTGIPNNAVVELKKLESGPRQFDKVVISIQLEDGTRLEPQEFKPDSTSLLNIIEHYLNLNTSNDVFKTAFDEKLTEQTDNYPTITYLNEQIIGLNQLKSTYLKDIGLTNGRFILKFLFRKIEKDQFEKLDQEFKSKLEKKLKLEEIFRKKQAQEEEENKLRHISSTNSVVMQESVSSPSQQQTQQQQQRQSPKRQRLEGMEYEQINPSSSSSNLIQYEESNQTRQNEFANFKFPEETRGKNLNTINELAEIERISKEACDRLRLLYNLDEASSNKEETSRELNDEFFDVTVQDLRLMLSDLKRTQNEEAPLMTKQMRELERDRKAMRYSKIVVRVAFKNRMVLQGLFRPKELVSELYKFVKESLSEKNTLDDLDFYLFSTPPKIILSEKKKTLFDSDLCPASLIYFKNKNDTVPIFKSDISLKTFEEAEEIVYTHVHKGIRDIKHEGLDVLEKEQVVVQNILKTSSLTSRQEQKSSFRSNIDKQEPEEKDNDQVKNKLERFLKGSKK